MLFGLNENTVVMPVEAMEVPAHLAESFTGIAAFGNTQAERLYEEVINAEGAFSAVLQKGVSSGTLDEACAEVIQEGMLGGYWKKVKDMFENLWKTVKALFEKFMAWLDGKVKSDKDFIAKYGETLKNKKDELKSMEYMGFVWKISSLDKSIATSITDAIGELKKDGDGKAAGLAKDVPTVNKEDEIAKGLMEIGKMVGSSKDTDAEIVADYNKQLHGGHLEADKLKLNDVSALITAVEKYEDDKKSAEDLKKAFDDAFKAAISIIEGMKSDWESENNKVHHLAGVHIAVAKAQAALCNRLVGTYLTALKDRRSEYRGVLAKAVGYKKK